MTRTSRAQNQAAYWQTRQAQAKTPQEIAAVWFDACRMGARQAEAAGRPQVWDELAQHLRAFYDSHQT